MTVKEIAKISGVSTATVSRVLNNGPVKKDTREKVEAAIRELNHMPDDLTKRSLGTSQKAYALVTHSVTNYFSMEFAETFINRCEQEEDVIVYVNRSDQYDKQYKCISDLLSRGVEGIVLHDPPLQNYDMGFLNKLSERIPLVIVHSNPDLYDVNSVMVDQGAGMRKACRYLLSQGLNKQLFLRGEFGFSFDLKQGIWEEEMAGNGRNPAASDVLMVDGADMEKGIERAFEVISEEIRRGNVPDAVFTCNDIMGVGALRAVEAAGLRVPEDISILSHDNTILASSFQLSSVDLKIPVWAHAALDLLDYAVNGRDSEPRKILITPDLVFRGTTAQE